MSKKIAKVVPELSDAEVADDLRRAIISALLRRRTWSSKDLRRALTVGEIATALVPRER